MRKHKLIKANIDRLIVLLDDHTDIFFAEREWLLDISKEPKILSFDERSRENEIKIEKAKASLSEKLREELLPKTLQGNQERIFGMDK